MGQENNGIRDVRTFGGYSRNVREVVKFYHEKDFNSKADRDMKIHGEYRS
jgi:hypothetical protein